MVGQSKETTINITLPEGETWDGQTVMTVPRTQPDAPLDKSDETCPGYRNMNTAWWDGSQIYGSSEEITSALRAKLPDGKLELIKYGKEDFLPRELDGTPRTGFSNNWWIGLELLHTLFALEHNAICDTLKKAYPTWTGYDFLFLPAHNIEPPADRRQSGTKSSTQPGWSTAP